MAFSHMLRVPQHDPKLNIVKENSPSEHLWNSVRNRALYMYSLNSSNGSSKSSESINAPFAYPYTRSLRGAFSSAFCFKNSTKSDTSSFRFSGKAMMLLYKSKSLFVI